MESFSGYDPDDVIQKYFTGSDQLTLTDTKLEEALRNGSSTNVDSAREDILGKLRVSMGPFNNYINRILTFFDHPPTPSKQPSKRGHLCYERKQFTDHPPTLACLRNY